MPGPLDIIFKIADISGVVAGLNKAAEAVDNFGERGGRAADAIGNLGAVSGATFGEASSLSGVFKALGMDPRGAAAAANSVRQRIASDPLAAMAYGRPLLPRALGGPDDNAAILERLINRLLDAKSDRQARTMAARVPELEPYLELRRADREYTRAILDNAKYRDRIVTRELLHERENLKAIQTVRQQNQAMMFEEIQVGLEKHFLIPFRTGMEVLKGGFARIGRDVVGGDWKDLGKILRDPIGFATGTAAGDTHGGGKKSADRLAESMEELAGAIRGLGRGIYGGGDRARGAIPAALSGFTLSKALESKAVELGAIRL